MYFVRVQACVSANWCVHEIACLPACLWAYTDHLSAFTNTHAYTLLHIHTGHVYTVPRKGRDTLKPLPRPWRMVTSRRQSARLNNWQMCESRASARDGYSIMQPCPYRGGPWQTRSLTPCPVTPKKIPGCIGNHCKLLFLKHTTQAGNDTRNRGTRTRRTRMLASRWAGPPESLSDETYLCMYSDTNHTYAYQYGQAPNVSCPLTHIHTTKIGNVHMCVSGHIYTKIVFWNTIAAKTNKNRHNPLLATLKLQLIQMRKTLKQSYKKQDSAHLLAHEHELKVTPFTTTINTAWKLLRDYKGDDSSASRQLPSQMRTNISADKRMWTEGDIQWEPHTGIKSLHQHRYHLVSIFEFALSRLGRNPKQIDSHRHSTHPTHPTRKSQILNSTKPIPGRKLRKC